MVPWAAAAIAAFSGLARRPGFQGYGSALRALSHPVNHGRKGLGSYASLRCKRIYHRVLRCARGGFTASATLFLLCSIASAPFRLRQRAFLVMARLPLSRRHGWPRPFHQLMPPSSLAEGVKRRSAGRLSNKPIARLIARSTQSEQRRLDQELPLLGRR